jgi:RNA polymerase sigma-70 factor (ECF subfamily)
MNETPSLIAMAKDGHRASFDDLIGPLLEQAYRLAYGFLREQQAAEDAVQEAAVKAWIHIGRLREGSDLRPWFLTIVANQCRSVQRGRWWSVLKGVDIDHASSPGDDAPEGSMDLQRVILGLQPADRALLILHYYHGLTLEEAAGVLRLSLGAAKSRLHRCLRRLRLQADIAEMRT